MIKENDWVLLIDEKGKEWLRKITVKGFLDTHKGNLPFSDVIGKEYGSEIPYTKGVGKLLLLEPSLEQIQAHMPHATNIIYDMDASLICFKANIRRGDRVLEIGTGSGGLTLFLATFLFENPESVNSKNGNFPIITLDNRSSHQKTAENNLKNFNLDHLVDFRTGDFEENNPLEDIPENYFDAVFFDITTPWKIINQIVKYVKYGKSIVIFVPNWAQIEKTVFEAEKNDNYRVMDVFEVFKRPMIVDAIKHVTRPLTRAIIYSGVIIHLIRKVK
ncbi:MAG: tRNA (adenine-N1)-methyltransferase [Candidatus Hodarchaeales archaeon]|jgi:tRNA (adenine57-N1/adenine58-N1)-methyltransferase